MVATGQVVTGGGAPHTHPWTEVTGEPTFALAADLEALDSATGAALAGKASTGSLTSLADSVVDLGGRVTALETAPPPVGGGSRASARGYVTTGDLTPQVTGTWAAFAGAPTFTIAAAAGDEIELQLACMILPAAGSSFFDVAVLVGGAPVRYASTGGAVPAVDGDPVLYPDNAFLKFQGPLWNFVASADDIEGGSVTLSFAVKSATGTGKIYASAAYPLRWALINHGSAS